MPVNNSCNNFFVVWSGLDRAWYKLILILLAISLTRDDVLDSTCDMC